MTQRVRQIESGGAVVLAVALGGMIGAAGRYAFMIGFPVEPGRFPLTTFAENVAGAFALGFVGVLLLDRLRRGRLMRPFLCTGVLGSFTTFSALSLETVTLAGDGRLWLAVAYPLASVVAGLTAALAGMMLARRWPGRGAQA
ncbi:MAG: CrcB family protein [Phycisphaeraceae bacterium]